MQIKAILLWLICIALVLIIGWLIFKMIDLSVTKDHQEQYAKVILKQRNLLVHVINTVSINEPEYKVRKMLKQVAEDSVFQKGNGELVAEQVSFFFKDGKFIRVDVGDDARSIEGIDK